MTSKVLENELLIRVKNITKEHKNNKHDLLAILLETQAIVPEQYIPKEVAQFISEQLQVSLSKIYDVITFYSALSEKPRGKHIIQICNSTACRVNKYETLKENLEHKLGIKVEETTPDGKFTLMCTPCFGACDISPAFRIGEEVYGNLTDEKIIEILENYRRV
jgi:NADH:ubiquinone oxidoreductase subunit E